ncbi:MAG TPA: STAS domain-containing protein [Mycobacterium sp.]|jgi:anti-anti-sigma regulatory factor
MVVTIVGDVDAANVEQLSAYTQRFALVKERMVLDLSNVNSFAAEAVSFLRSIADGCSAAGVEWILVASSPVLSQLREFYDAATVPVADSVAEALHRFADVIDARREALLPLVKKTA